LTEPDASLTEQPGLIQNRRRLTSLRDDAISWLAEIAWQVNEKTENIGAPAACIAGTWNGYKDISSVPQPPRHKTAPSVTTMRPTDEHLR
jgi:hypothetical protein